MTGFIAVGQSDLWAYAVIALGIIAAISIAERPWCRQFLKTRRARRLGSASACPPCTDVESVPDRAN
jgi:hypothetical protein